MEYIKTLFAKNPTIKDPKILISPRIPPTFPKTSRRVKTDLSYDLEILSLRNLAAKI